MMQKFSILGQKDLEQKVESLNTSGKKLRMNTIISIHKKNINL